MLRLNMIRPVLVFANFLVLTHLQVFGLSQWHLSSLNSPSFTLASTSMMNSRTCPIDSPASCQNTTSVPNTCCFIYPGGQLLSTQFWTSNPAVGPKDSWTIHGLWPDYCNGSYPAYCSAAPTYKNISEIISISSTSLLKFMNTYWLPDRGSADDFWQHEWNKHGTCINTLATSCYTSSNYTAGDEVMDYFLKAVELFKRLDTYKALESEGILPSDSKRYTKSEIQHALTRITGNAAVLGCQDSELNQVWYTFNVKGSLQTGEFLPVHPGAHGWPGNCPQTGIKYLPKKTMKRRRLKKIER